MNASTNNGSAIVWLRNDLRLADNPALDAARKTGAAVIPLYILDDAVPWAPGGASRWWLHHSLAALGGGFSKTGTSLIVRRGNTAEVLKSVIEESNASHVFWNRRYFADHIDIDKKLKSELVDDGVTVETFNGALLREPWELKTGSGGFYKVYTPFWKSLKAAEPARSNVLPAPRKLTKPKSLPKSDKLDDWKLLPTAPDWASPFHETWTPGEAGARAKLIDFFENGIEDYAEGRNRPDKEYVSRLSPHLAFGEISPLQVWSATQNKMAEGKINDKPAWKFLSELVWRDFSYNLLFHKPDMPTQPLRKEFAAYPWREDAAGLRAWQKGMTGYPIVDAGMRQLWQTGWMHNRVRMIVASFLIKDLLIPWQEGEKWFWDTLVDADIANNAASWQWVAGCGADASPYFRIFNPITQGEKFDPDGNYVREFVPELKAMPAKFIHAPWKAPELVLQEAEVVLGENYPEPIVDHAFARKRALEGYDVVKNER